MSVDHGRIFSICRKDIDRIACKGIAQCLVGRAIGISLTYAAEHFRTDAALLGCCDYCHSEGNDGKYCSFHISVLLFDAKVQVILKI